MIVVGIDPGQKGGIAVISCNCKGLQVEVFDMFNDFSDLVSFFWDLKRKSERSKDGRLIVFIEKQSPFPKQGVVSTFKLGRSYGELIGVLRTLGISFEEVSSHRWKRFFGLNSKALDRKKRKEFSLEKAKSLFPELVEKIGKSDGKAEALLIAEYCRRLFALSFSSV